MKFDFYESARRVRRIRSQKRLTHKAGAIIFVALMAHPFTSALSNELNPKEALGKAIFFDTSLSEPEGQACASCHVPEAGFSGPASATDGHAGVEPGAVTGRFGNRKAPSVSYASFSPNFYFDKTEKHYVGGQFLDGRAASLADQAKLPFLNPLEMNNASGKAVCEKILASSYADQFATAFASQALDCGDDGEAGYTFISQALAAYEASAEVNPFSSKFDYVVKGKATFTPLEKQGRDLFDDAKKAACAECHPSTGPKAGIPALFTDFTYDNLGMPANRDNPFFVQNKDYNPAGENWKDKGLGGIVNEAEFIGAFKVPTLRNVAKHADDQISTYGHNGLFTSLEEIVHFYNTRDVKGALPGGHDWAPGEFPATQNTEELGNLKLSAADEAALVAFMKTLSDGFDPETGAYPE